MDPKTVLSGPNVSDGPFTRPATVVMLQRARSESTRPSITTSNSQYGLERNGSVKTYPWTSQTGLGHEYPPYPDHRRMYVQGQTLKVAEHPVSDLHAPSDYECLKPRCLS